MNNIEFVMLGLDNPKETQTLKAWTFNNLDYVNQEKCLDANLKWYCEDSPHITIAAKLLNQSSNDIFRTLKYSKPDIWKEFRDKVVKKKIFLTFPELLVDTFNNEDCIVLKINCINCNYYTDLVNLHKLFDNKPNQSEHTQYQPHITLTYLKKSTPLKVIENMINELKVIIPRSYNLTQFNLGNDKDEIDTIQF